MKIASATPDDALPIANILWGWNAVTPWMPQVHSRAAIKGFCRDMISRGWVDVARINGRVVGFLARNGCEIHALYLVPHMRGRGVGKALLDWAKRSHERLGLYAFAANDGACRFYQREGFRAVARGDGRDNDEGLPEIRFEWRAEA